MRLLDDVHESLDVHPGSLPGVLLEHLPAGERGEMVDDVDVRRQIVVEDVCLDELDVVVEVLRRAEIAVVQCHDVVAFAGEVVREVRADEPGTAGDQHATVVHVRSVFQHEHMATGAVARRTNCPPP